MGIGWDVAWMWLRVGKGSVGRSRVMWYRGRIELSVRHWMGGVG